MTIDDPCMNKPAVQPPLRRVLYHHRTQGKAVEGVHIRGITDALRAEGVTVDIISLPGADPYASPKALSPSTTTASCRRARHPSTT